MKFRVGLRHLTTIKLERFLDAESSRQTESSSPGSSRGPSSLPEQGNTSTLEGVRSTLLTASQHSRRDQHHRWSHRKHEVIYFPARTLKVFLLCNNLRTFQLFQHQQNRTYEESKRGQDEDQADVDEARLKAQEAVSHLCISLDTYNG